MPHSQPGFLRRPGRSGPFAALLDECARAAEDFCRCAESFDDAEFTRERESTDPDTVSARAVCRHVVGAAHRYANYIADALRDGASERFELTEGMLNSPEDVRPLVAAALRHTEDVVESLHGSDYDAVRALEFQVRWGPRYDPEMLLEHAIAHFLRHRRQLERW